jgi:acetoin utilization deacetylase AcuC-like enzyme
LRFYVEPGQTWGNAMNKTAEPIALLGVVRRGPAIRWIGKGLFTGVRDEELDKSALEDMLKMYEDTSEDVGAATDAVDNLNDSGLTKEEKAACKCTRAFRSTPNGFCILNNVVVGLTHARLKWGLRKIAVVDIDAHFGNGTAELLQGDPDAFYASVHLHDPHGSFFPGEDLTRTRIEGSPTNFVSVGVSPVPEAMRERTAARIAASAKESTTASTNRKTSRISAWRAALQGQILPALRAFKPELLLISAGFDGLATDPLGGMMGLSIEDYAWATRLLVWEANADIRGGFGKSCKGRVVSVLEGGYDLEPETNGLAQAVEAHLRELMGIHTWPDHGLLC